MSVKIIKTETEHWPAVKLIGKTGTAWGDWWANGWFDILEKSGTVAPVNGDSFIGLKRGKEYWIGMLFTPDTPVPEDFSAVPLPGGEVAFCYVYGPEDSSDFFTPETQMLCTAALKEKGLMPAKNGIMIERYACPNYTTPDEQGNVILDLGFTL